MSEKHWCIMCAKDFPEEHEQGCMTTMEKVIVELETRAEALEIDRSNVKAASKEAQETLVKLVDRYHVRLMEVKREVKKRDEALLKIASLDMSKEVTRYRDTLKKIRRSVKDALNRPQNGNYTLIVVLENVERFTREALR